MQKNALKACANRLTEIHLRVSTCVSRAEVTEFRSINFVVPSKR
jgi:hypothetical protein